MNILEMYNNKHRNGKGNVLKNYICILEERNSLADTLNRLESLLSYKLTKKQSKFIYNNSRDYSIRFSRREGASTACVIKCLGFLLNSKTSDKTIAMVTGFIANNRYLFDLADEIMTNGLNRDDFEYRASISDYQITNKNNGNRVIFTTGRELISLSRRGLKISNIVVDTTFTNNPDSLLIFSPDTISITQ